MTKVTLVGYNILLSFVITGELTCTQLFQLQKSVVSQLKSTQEIQYLNLMSHDEAWPD